jgi:lipoprotein-anchoring transpeptidase ErfK/SrfK
MMKRLIPFALLGVAAFAFASLPMRAQEGTTITAFATNTPLPNEATLPLLPTATPAPVVQNVQPYEPEVCRYVEGQRTSEACRDIIRQFPKPDVKPINIDAFTLSRYSFWRVGPQAVNVYSAPNGEVSSQIPQGFNFVNVVEEQEGWIKSQNGGWINKEDAYYVKPSYFTGVTLPEGWNQPFAWVLDTTGIYASTYPGGPSTSESGLVPLHYERYNIFAEAMGADGWMYYMVGPDQWVKQIYLAIVKPTPRPEGVSGRWVAVDLYEQTLVAYDEANRPVFATLISTGLPNTETNEGVFEVWARLARDTMSGSTGAPNAYALQSVPWVQYFDASISLHGTYWHDFFGYRRSRGCVNLSISDAKWVYDFFNNVDNGETAYVYVHSTGEYRKP